MPGIIRRMLLIGRQKQDVLRRSMASGVASGPVFDVRAKRAQRERAMACPEADRFGYLRDEVASSLVGRLEVISSDYTFPVAVDLGATGHILKNMEVNPGIERLVECSADPNDRLEDRAHSSSLGLQVERISYDCNDGELPFETGSVDLVMSCLAMHWANNLPGLLKSIRRVLKPNGVFLGALLGGETLQELRTALQLAEQEREGGIGHHVSPMLGAADAASLMQSAGFALPTVDIEHIEFNYADMFVLMRHLQGMGENNAVVQRRPFTSRETFVAANAIYDQMYSDCDLVTKTASHAAGVPATFQVVHLIGWSPHESQQTPKRRGSATASFKDIESEPTFITLEEKGN